MENIKEIQKEYEELFKSVEDYHTHMRRLTMNFDGDEMAARSYKHVTNSTMVSDFPTIYHVIKGSKVRLDRKIGQNQGVLDNEDFLKKMIREEARIEMKTNQLAIWPNKILIDWLNRYLKDMKRNTNTNE